MAKNNRFTLKYRRRREGKTNYHKRLQLLRSRKTRLVIRKTNNNTIIQFVNYKPDGDEILLTTSTKALEKLGWKHNTSNLPSAYLTGFLAGTMAKSKKIKESIVDLGLQKPSHGGRLFAAVKGVQDAGINVSVGEQALPSEERATGTHINETITKDVEAVKKKIGAQ